METMTDDLPFPIEFILKSGEATTISQAKMIFHVRQHVCFFYRKKVSTLGINPTFVFSLFIV